MKADTARIAAIARRWPDDLRLVLLHGPDGAASRDHADALARQFADAGNPMAVETLHGASLAADPQALVAAAGAMSMFGDRTLVRVEGLDDNGLDAVEALLAGPPGNPVVALAGSLKKGSKLQALADRSPAIAALISYEPSARDAGRLASDIGAELGLRPTRDAAMLLFEAAGGDRMVMRRELEKLGLYLDATPDRPRPLEADAVAALAAGAGDADQFGLAGAIAGGHVDQAADLLARLTPGLGIVALRAVERRMMLLLSLRSAVDGGAAPRAVVEAARPPIFWKEKDAMVAELGAWTTPALAAALADLLGAERGIKARGSLGETLAHATLLDLVRRAAVARRRAGSA
ncbi:DNA polymerase III subunit delta [Polymorphobacter fuscus]|uniref:DNA-directed DNA polymerase n=1 Tax=Sandarakinorhabdus fusca TaxID=1439888 RepID=A0A7C9KWH6_9SPHN|nr:DNA polymerase III subunit delta [Polymorphobacter fuscus]KAB7647694.1 DNA polymerase III subunit delta [Polymorphobacter fuscus]MQT16985.1 DNA polymerase III subunit delta [Polymorphobacter fuscus]NJC09024.1 DNA polymerase-3 subunit delta [Polymorphobacter fuscus]